MDDSMESLAYQPLKTLRKCFAEVMVLRRASVRLNDLNALSRLSLPNYGTPF